MGTKVTSLSTLLEESQTRSVIDANISQPLLSKKPPLLIPPAKGVDYGGIGTAYDYWLRCQIKPEITKTLLGYRVCLERYSDHPPIRKALEKHCRALESFWAGKLRNGEPLLEACLFLAKFETEFRSGHSVDSIFIKRSDVDELDRIAAATEVARFKRQDSVLNPLFTIRGTKLTIKADGDLVVEGTLIDLKTGSRIDLKDNLRQLVGYWILNDLVEPRIPIHRVGVYYARFNYFLDFPIPQLLNGRQREAISVYFRNLMGTNLKRAKRT